MAKKDKMVWNPGDVTIYRSEAAFKKANKVIKPRPISKKNKKG